VRDEADIVRQTVNFHLERGVDFIIATDNGSIDGTRDILDAFARAGSLRLISEPTHDFSQNVWVTRMAHLARDDHGADWIINGDADEFWHVDTGDVKLLLSAIDENVDVVTCPRRNMIYGHDASRTGAWHQDLIYRVAVGVPMPALEDPFCDPLPAPYFYLDLPAKALCRARGLKEVAGGNHWASYSWPTVALRAPINVYHYPIRSFAQFVTKIVNGGAAYTRNTSLPASNGWHWRRWYRMVLERRAADALGEALPSTANLQHDVSTGRVVTDLTMASLAAPPGPRASPSRVKIE
jgi:hypothetical protein